MPNTALVNEALQRFDDNARRIANAITNFNKLGRNNQTRVVTEGRFKLLDKYWSEAQLASTQIDVYATADDRETLEYYSDNLLEKTEESYLVAYDFFQEKLATFVPVAAGGGATGTSGAGSGPPASAYSEFKLPTISVPQFSGILTDWIAFRDLFSSLITSRVGLSNVQKLHYLLSVVTDDAAKLISHISLSDDNFAVAWKILKDHYENQRSIVNAHLSNFFAIAPVTPNDSVNGLKKLRASSSESIHALQALQRPVDAWNDILVFCIVQKFDKNTRREWEIFLGDGSDYPRIDNLNKFIDTRIRALEAAASGQPSEKAPESSGKRDGKSNPKLLRSHHGAATDPCVLCSEPHKLAQCGKFKSKSIAERQQCARHNYLCINCLTKGHVTADCRSTFNCYHCKRRHHSLLHDHRRDRNQVNTTNPAVPSVSSNSSDPQTNTSEQFSSNVTHAHVATQAPVPSQTVLLATAWVHLESDQGRQIHARALIDPGSDASFISENLVQCLRLTRERTNAYVASIGGQSASTVKSTVALDISPIQDPSKDKLRIKALVLPQITAYLPSKVSIDMAFAKGLILADPAPMSPAPIELLLGADLYADILIDGIRKEMTNKLILQNTIFGWIISGAVSNSSSSQRTIHVHHASTQAITSELLQFFKTEEVPSASRKYLTSAEKQCESQFEKTYYTLSKEGTSERRYVVRLPFKMNPPIPIGDTRARALASYRHLEKRLQRDADLDKQYSAFLREYHDSNHMEQVKLSSCTTQTVFLPHHPVMKDSTTTKVRVVFNASALSSNGSSLNDHLLPGPNLQPELVAVILNWRTFRYVYTADIAQMFRQILVDPRDRNYQLIFWRSSPEEEIQPYALTTVTYGTACAPFLAQRVLLQVAEDEGREFPLAVPILRKQRYMDDLMFGDDSKENAIQKRIQVTDCLSRAGFPLRKWASNDPTLLAGIESTNHGLALNLPLEAGSKLKILGLHWEPSSDSFHIVAQLQNSPLPTKRQILSLIARCFDPLGWLAPVLIGPKILVQRLWLLKLDWDEPVIEEMTLEWQLFCEQLPCLNQIAIPRWTASDRSSSVEIHGFCDASERAFAAGAYLRVRSVTSEVKVNLMIAKTRVAPLKTITIPRLELCAAVLLVRCVSILLESISIPIESITCWSDSSVVLCWLKKPPATLKTFTAHRVAEIQEQLPQANWKHVPSEDNPADCASRGLSPRQLKGHPLWWHGPQWLSSDPSEWPDQTFLDFASTEVDSKLTTHVHLRTSNQRPENRFGQLLRDVSTWNRLLRITAYVLRFVARLKNTTPVSSDLALQVQEISAAETFWLRYAQEESFPSEVKALAKRAPVPTNSPLRSLDPQVDDAGLIRLGGRLHQADIPSNQKHPVILANNRVSQLLIAHIHRITLHGGTQLMLRVLRQNYWVLRGRNLVRNVLHKCVRCTRERAQTRYQFMASLPRARIVQSRPFSHCGVDYAGPFLVRDAAGRGRTSHKAYISLFICLATRAIHLELVHDYGSAAFLAAFQRFSSRRGLPSQMYSDNGTTFQGAERELREAFNKIIREVDFRNIFATDQVAWQFLPPAAPHFGGLWEAGVKSVKYHLKRIMQNSTPTIEEFTTLLCKIEAVLNSRPIAPLSDDPSSYDVLTPGHFLIGEPVKSVPLPSTLHLSENRMDRWQLMQNKFEQFWKIWSQDYIHSLQQRMKWQKREPNLQIGDLVLIRNENLPPSKWSLARVLECFHDRENLVRSVRVKTATSEYIRPIVKLCKLPVSTESESQCPESVAVAQS